MRNVRMRSEEDKQDRRNVERRYKVIKKKHTWEIKGKRKVREIRAKRQVLTIARRNMLERKRGRWRVKRR